MQTTFLNKKYKIILLLPFVFLLLTLGIPILRLFSIAFFDKSFTLKYFQKIFTTRVYINVIFQTFKLALKNTFLCIILGYPVAYLATTSKYHITRKIIDTIMLSSFCISTLVRNFALYVVLSDNGFINSILSDFNIIDHPLKLIYNEAGVLIGLLLSLLPYAYLNLIAIMETINPEFRIASQILGAKPYHGFVRIFLPLSIKGMISSCIIIFVYTLGYYITPALLGNASNTMISVLIHNHINTTQNWELASALSIVMLILTLVLLIPFVFCDGFSIFGMSHTKNTKGGSL